MEKCRLMLTDCKASNTSTASGFCMNWLHKVTGVKVTELFNGFYEIEGKLSPGIYELNQDKETNVVINVSDKYITFNVTIVNKSNYYDKFIIVSEAYWPESIYKWEYVRNGRYIPKTSLLDINTYLCDRINEPKLIVETLGELDYDPSYGIYPTHGYIFVVTEDHENIINKITDLYDNSRYVNECRYITKSNILELTWKRTRELVGVELTKLTESEFMKLNK